MDNGLENTDRSIARDWHRACERWVSQRHLLEITLMNSDPRQASVQVDDIPKDMKELVLEIEQLPLPLRARLEPIMQRVVDSTKRRRRILSLVQEALSQLRLDMKYLVFDLEATRRERDAYKQSLEGGSAE